MAASVLKESGPKAFDAAVVPSLVGELIAHIADELKARLHRDRLFIVPGLPMVIEGEALALPPMVASPKVSLPLSHARGRAWVELALADLNEMRPKEDESSISLFVYADAASPR